MLALLPKFIDLHRETSTVLQEFSEYGTLLVSQHFEHINTGSAFAKQCPTTSLSNCTGDMQEQYGALTTVARQTYSVHGGGNPMYWRVAT